MLAAQTNALRPWMRLDTSSQTVMTTDAVATVVGRERWMGRTVVSRAAEMKERRGSSARIMSRRRGRTRRVKALQTLIESVNKAHTYVYR